MEELKQLFSPAHEKKKGGRRQIIQPGCKDLDGVCAKRGGECRNVPTNPKLLAKIAETKATNGCSKSADQQLEDSADGNKHICVCVDPKKLVLPTKGKFLRGHRLLGGIDFNAIIAKIGDALIPALEAFGNFIRVIKGKTPSTSTATTTDTTASTTITDTTTTR